MDVDFDLKPSFEILEHFNATLASKVSKNNTLEKHPCGAYFQKIAVDSITGLSAIPFKEAEEVGYLKIDFLSLNLLDYFQSTEQVWQLSELEPNWDMLEKKKTVQKLFHIANHFKLINKVKPRNIVELADCLALRIPSKKHLIESYMVNKVDTRLELYRKIDVFYYKKSHAIAYAHNVVLHMHLINYGIEKNVVT